MPCLSVRHLSDNQLFAHGLYEADCTFPHLQTFSIHFSFLISVPPVISICADVSRLRGISQHKPANVHYASSRLHHQQAKVRLIKLTEEKKPPKKLPSS